MIPCLHLSSTYVKRSMGLHTCWPDTGWTFFTVICCKNCIAGLERQKENEKEDGDGPFEKWKDQKCDNFTYVRMRPTFSSCKISNFRRQLLQNDDVTVEIDPAKASQHKKSQNVAKVWNDVTARNDGAVFPKSFDGRPADERVDVQVPSKLKDVTCFKYH